MANTLKTISELKSALFFAKMQKNKYYNSQENAKSVLISALDRLSQFSEEELSKKQLLDTLKLMLAYTREHNKYVYCRDQVTRLTLKIEETKEAEFNGNFIDTDGQN